MTKNETRNIGIETATPSKVPKTVEPKDPFFGSVKVNFTDANGLTL